MMQRLHRYTIHRWASEFIKSLEGIKEIQEVNLTRKINISRMHEIVAAYAKTENRILFLDYDGTLSWFKKDPEDAKPDEQLYGILEQLSAGETLNWDYKDTQYEKVIDPEGVTTEYVRCIDPTASGIVVKVTRTKLPE